MAKSGFPNMGMRANFDPKLGQILVFNETTFIQ